MSNFRAIAAVSATLQSLLSNAVRESVPGATVVAGPPRDRPSHEIADGLINVFLYKVEPDPIWLNEELPYRLSDGTLIRKPQLAINLYYLLSFYGDDNKYIPSLLLGTSLAALHAEPYPHPRHVPRAAPDQSEESEAADPLSLADSGLLQQRHSLSFTLLSSKQDDVTQLWSTLLQVPYVTSVLYLARVVTIEPSVVPQPALPAREVSLSVTSRHQPQLVSILPQSFPYAPGAGFELRGVNLSSELLEIRIGHLETVPHERSATSLKALLPDGVQAGANLVRVFHGRRIADGTAVRWDVESNPLAFVLQPVVRDVEVLPPAQARDDEEPPPPRHRLRVRFAPAVRSATPALVLLNESPPPGREAPRGAVLEGLVDPQQPDLVEVETDLGSGRFLLRVQIRGVASPLTIDDDPESPTSGHYNGPALDLT